MRCTALAPPMMAELFKTGRGSGALLLCLLAASSSGCVTVYHPLVSLQRPVAIDPQIANFEDVRLRVRCVPGDYLDAEASEALCRSVRTTFENQSAQVDTEVPRNGASAAA